VFKEILDIHTQRGGSVLFSTHIMEVAENLCDRIAIINKGRLVAIGTMEELRSQAKQLDAHFDLEDIFLRLTEEDENIKQIIEQMRKTLLGGE